MTDFASLLMPVTASTDAFPIRLATDSSFETLPVADQDWILSAGHEPSKPFLCLVPDGADKRRFVAGLGKTTPTANNIWWLAGVCEALPNGDYLVEGILDPDVLAAGALGWILAQYRFDRYLSESRPRKRRLILPDSIDREPIIEMAQSMALVRDLVNTPAEDMGPGELQATVEALAREFDADCWTVVGDDLLVENFPSIHAVGRAAASGREPRMTQLEWGRKDAPRIALVGKGVCFDTGGLNLKPSNSMRLMKKDMAGAAHAIGLARMIMSKELDVRLHLLVPAAENAIGNDAFRPGDVVATRKGLSVEIDNTDAEGRMLLCDALALASEGKPEMIFDFATLTGANTAALGTDLHGRLCK